VEDIEYSKEWTNNKTKLKKYIVFIILGDERKPKIVFNFL